MPKQAADREAAGKIGCALVQSGQFKGAHQFAGHSEQQQHAGQPPQPGTETGAAPNGPRGERGVGQHDRGFDGPPD
jgi:hypothetical protein